MAKNNRHGKAAIWNDSVIRIMRQNLKSAQQRLIFEISLYTGERMGAIVQLKVHDAYGKDGKVLDSITYPGVTRKGSKHGTAKTRQIWIHDHLKIHLQQYSHADDGFLFPSDRSSSGHITCRAVDDYWRKILDKYGYSGFSTHSSRRWVINMLRRNGVEIVTIAEALTINIATVKKYLDDDPAECKRAIATLSV